MQATRKCHQCGLEKPVDDFGQRSRGGWRDRCRSCRRDYMRARRTEQRQEQADRIINSVVSGARQARRRWAKSPDAAAELATHLVMAAVNRLGGPDALVDRLVQRARGPEDAKMALALLDLMVCLAPPPDDIQQLSEAELRQVLQAELQRMTDDGLI